MSRPSILNFVFSSIKIIPGVGNKTYEKLKKKVGDRVLDLLFFLPKNIKILHRIIDLDQEYIGKDIIFFGTVIKHIVKNNNKGPYCIIVHCKNTPVYLMFFLKQTKFLIKKFPIGKNAIFSGKLLKFTGGYQIIHPICKEQDHFPIFEIIYSTIQGITSQRLYKMIEYCLNNLPKTFPLKNVLWDIHHPTSIKEILPNSYARQILAYQEILVFQIQLLYRKCQKKKSLGIPIPVNDILRNDFLNRLSFTLTESQSKSLKFIDSEMNQSVRMMHLLQGDVGSGKTIIAILAGLSAMSLGMQVLILVPTALLAKQHAITISTLLNPFNLKTAYITKSNKDDIYAIQNGEIACIIGTHALLSNKIQYKKLGLIVIDEQHRFGVYQRLSIIEKENHAHVLIMTATPIPRTLALFFYGDLSISFLTHKPKDKKCIQTSFVHESKILLLINKLNKILKYNEKIFWVCPLIENCNELKLTSIEYRFNFLKRYFDESILFVIHGKMLDKKKELVMQSFLDSSQGILITTNVIEVGINIPDATVMIIENPERFGLATLHQLRGRLTRGNLPGYCILLINSAMNSTNSINRLKVFQKISDGILLAEEDLKQRGMGDLFGIQQSGFPFFYFVNLSWHQDLFVKAKKEAEFILKKYPDLNQHEIQILLHLFSHDSKLVLWNN